MKKLGLLGIVLVISLTSGCTFWTHIKKPERKTYNNAISVVMPLNWVFGDFYKKGLLVTKDGPGVQVIIASHYEFDKAFPKIKKVPTASTLPAELAEMYVAELKTIKATQNVEVVSNKPAVLLGQPGFRLHLRFKDDYGLRIERLVYGMADKSGVYVIHYQAPTLTFFKRDLPVFENLVATAQKKK